MNEVRFSRRPLVPTVSGQKNRRKDPSFQGEVGTLFKDSGDPGDVSYSGSDLPVATRTRQETSVRKQDPVITGDTVCPVPS